MLQKSVMWTFLLDWW